MARKKATRKTTRAASAKKSAAKASPTPRKKSRRKATPKKVVKKASGRTAKGAAKRAAGKSATTRGSSQPAPDPAPPPPIGPTNPAGGERALLGRGPWWWRESRSKSTPEAPDAADYRRDHVDDRGITPSPPMRAVTPINLDALMPPEPRGEPVEDRRADAAPVEPFGPPPPPDLDPSGSSDPLEVLLALTGGEDLQVPESEAVTDPLEAPLSREALDTVTMGESAALDEVIEALKILEGCDGPAPPVEAAPEIAETEAPHEGGQDPPGAATETATAPQANEPLVDDAAAPVGEPEPSVVTFDKTPEPEAVEAPAPVTEAEPPAEAFDPPGTIEQLDREVADNVDDLLQGDFESVDELLEGGFDEPAPQTDRAGQPDEPADADRADEAAEPADGVGASSETDVETEIAVAETIDGSLDDPPEKAGGDGPLHPADVADPEPVPAAASTSTVVRRTAEPRTGSPPAGPIVAMLEWLNVPRRRLPTSARAVVDWIALSLLLWVPVVWVFALMFAG
jgi:hypothetical protein